jgi:hypothetical protein
MNENPKQRSTTEAQESIDDDDQGETKEEISTHMPIPEPSVAENEESPSSHHSASDDDDVSSAYPDT